MNYSSTWRGKISLVIIDISEESEIYTGTAQLFSQGEKIGTWTGGNYGIDQEWDTLERAINNLCVFMISELGAQEIIGRIDHDQDLLENICHGRARAEQGEQDRKAEYKKECEEDNLLDDLKDGRELLAESIKEMSSQDYLTIKTNQAGVKYYQGMPIEKTEPSPVEAGEQLGLFG